MENIRDILADRVRFLRAKARLSQDELARAAGNMTRAYVSEIEGGKRLASIETVARLARALGVGPDALLKGGTAKNPRPAPRPTSTADKLGQKVAKLAKGASERRVHAFEIVARAFFIG